MNSQCIQMNSDNVMNENTRKDNRMYWNIILQEVLIKSESHTVYT